MAIYHFSAQIIYRSQGRSSVAAGAYRSAEKLLDDRTGKESEYCYEEGLRDYCLHLADGAEPLHKDVIVIRGEDTASGLSADTALLFTDSYTENMVCFANNMLINDRFYGQ